MNSRRLLALTSGFFLLAVSINLFAQTSPWPFPSRPGTAPQQTAVAPSGPSLRVAFWNIKWFPGGRPNAYKGEETKQILAVQQDITKLNADVIGFEEVRNWDAVGLAIKPLPGFKVDVCANFPPREGQTETQQVAIASRLQPMSAWFEEWKAGSAITPPRGFAFAAYQLAPQQILLVYAVHLKSNRGELVEDVAIREESVRQLLVHIKDMEAAYAKLGSLIWLIGGDFNTAPDDARFQSDKTVSMLTGNNFLWCWQNVPFQNRVTMPPDKRFPAACFDHILYRGATLKKAEALQTSETSSDHHAIRAEFALPTTR